MSEEAPKYESFQYIALSVGLSDPVDDLHISAPFFFFWSQFILNS